MLLPATPLNLFRPRRSSSRRHIVCVGKDTLQFGSDSSRPLGPFEIRIRVEFAGVSFADSCAGAGLARSLPPYPYVPGRECAGVVDSIGSSISSFAPGDRVAAYLPRFGAYSRFIVAEPHDLVHIPSRVSTQQAASMIVNYLNASVLLHHLGQAQEGQRVVVTSAAGGIGTAVLDLGRLAGLQMFGIASGPKHRVVLSRNARAIDHQNQDIEAEIRKHAPEGVDLFIDNVGGNILAKGYRLLRKGGRLISNGALSVRRASPFSFMPLTLSLYGRRLIPDRKRVLFNTGLNPIVAQDKNWYRQHMRQLLSLVALNRITPLIDRIMPLSQAANAHQLLEAGQARGKIVLDCRL